MLFADKLGMPKKIKDLAESLDLEVTNHHDPEFDAKLCALIFGELTDKYPSYQELIRKIDDQPKTNNNYFNQPSEDVLEENEEHLSNYQITQNELENIDLIGKGIVITGNFSIEREEIKTFLMKIGGQIKSGITGKVEKIANNVVAIENDTALVEHLRKLFSDARNVQVVGCDFRNFAVPKFPFKVVSNIPYGITSDIFKILMFESLGNFLGGSIVLQLEPTQKLFSRKLYNPYTVFYHTFFDLKLVYEVGPESFFPPPTVKSALLNIKRKQLFFDFKFKAKYLAFISCLLEKPDLSVKTALKSIFRKSQVRSISEKFGLNLNAQIVCLSPSQWVNCFLEMLEVVPEKFHPS